MNEETVTPPEMPEVPMQPEPESPLEKIKKIRFERNKDTNYNFSHVYTEYIQVGAVNELEERTQRRDQMEEYFTALAKHLEVQARNIYKSIDILPTFVDSVVNTSSMVSKDILESNEPYTQFLTENDADGLPMAKNVLLCIKIGITKNKAGELPMLVWVITSHAWVKSANDDTKIDLTNTIQLFSE